MTTPFHVAVPVHDLQACKEFYVDHFQCELGRTSDHWVDLNLYGHQFVLHYKATALQDNQSLRANNEVDGKSVPVPHFGVVLTMEKWKALAERLKQKQAEFVIEPYIRFEGQVGEQGTMFLLDPSGNALEFKGFNNMDDLFAS